LRAALLLSGLVNLSEGAATLRLPFLSAFLSIAVAGYGQEQDKTVAAARMNVEK
jgi:hypothetical protein